MPFAFLPGTARPAAFPRGGGAPAGPSGPAARGERAPGARPLVAALVACAAIAAPPASHAQERPAATASRITQVTVAPGIATIERSARLPAGARSATFACLPAGLDPDSLQISADAGVRVGEFKVTTEDRDVAAGCASPLDDRIRALEDRIADVQADITALRRVDRYLDHVAGQLLTAVQREASALMQAVLSGLQDFLRWAKAQWRNFVNGLELIGKILQEQFKQLGQVLASALQSLGALAAQVQQAMVALGYELEKVVNWVGDLFGCPVSKASNALP